MTLEQCRQNLVAVLDRNAELAIAVSGGVDSMVLTYIAHRFSKAEVTAIHAVSPAVPTVATERVEAHARRHGWSLRLIDAGELRDPAYRANPVNRCFYCKTNLYDSIRAVTAVPIASGTNVDDLSDFRPGLAAARDRNVLHPFVEAGVRKAEIYALAAAHGLNDLAALPAQPCLASRIETGIGVDAQSLQFIERVEGELLALLPAASAIRCRITPAGIQVECSPLPQGEDRARSEERVRELCAEAGRPLAGFRPYQRGSAFLRDVAG